MTPTMPARRITSPAAALTTALLGFALVILDASAVNVGLPAIRDDVEVSAAALS